MKGRPACVHLCPVILGRAVPSREVGQGGLLQVACVVCRCGRRTHEDMGAMVLNWFHTQFPVFPFQNDHVSFLQMRSKSKSKTNKQTNRKGLHQTNVNLKRKNESLGKWLSKTTCYESKMTWVQISSTLVITRCGCMPVTPVLMGKWVDSGSSLYSQHSQK